MTHRRFLCAVGADDAAHATKLESSALVAAAVGVRANDSQKNEWPLEYHMIMRAWRHPDGENWLLIQAVKNRHESGKHDAIRTLYHGPIKYVMDGLAAMTTTADNERKGLDP